MSQQDKCRYWAVTGRIPGDDEDSLRIYHATSREEALEHFERGLWADELEDAKEATLERYGQTVYVNTVVVSDTAIRQA